MEDLVETSQEGRGVGWGGVGRGGAGSFSHTFWHVINPSRGIRVAVVVCFVSGEFGRLVSVVVPVRGWMSVVLMPVPGSFPPTRLEICWDGSLLYFSVASRSFRRLDFFFWGGGWVGGEWMGGCACVCVWGWGCFSCFVFVVV